MSQSSRVGLRQKTRRIARGNEGALGISSSRDFASAVGSGACAGSRCGASGSGSSGTMGLGSRIGGDSFTTCP